MDLLLPISFKRTTPAVRRCKNEQQRRRSYGRASGDVRRYAAGLACSALSAMARADGLGDDATLEAVDRARAVLHGPCDDARVLAAAAGLLEAALEAARGRAEDASRRGGARGDALRGPNAVATAVLKAAAAPRALQSVWRVFS